MPNSTLGNSSITLPLSPAERSRLYSRIIRRNRRPRSCRIRVKGWQVKSLVKRGYLGTNEIGDSRAIREAVNLFLWHTIQKSRRGAAGARGRRQIASKRAKR